MLFVCVGQGFQGNTLFVFIVSSWCHLWEERQETVSFRLVGCDWSYDVWSQGHFELLVSIHPQLWTETSNSHPFLISHSGLSYMQEMAADLHLSCVDARIKRQRVQMLQVVSFASFTCCNYVLWSWLMDSKLFTYMVVIIGILNRCCHVCWWTRCFTLHSYGRRLLI